MAGRSASGSETIASPTSAAAAPPVFVDTSLGTHVVLVVSPEETVADFKRKVCIEHAACFPGIGSVSVSSIKVRRKATYYHLSDSMLVRTAFNGIKGSWFVQMDMIPVTGSARNGESLERERDSNINGEAAKERERAELEEKSDSDLLKGQRGERSNIMVNPIGDDERKTSRLESPSDGRAVGDEEGVVSHDKILFLEKSTKSEKKKHKKHRQKKEADVAQRVDQLGILGELCSQLLDKESVLEQNLIEKKRNKKKKRRDETELKKKDSSFEEAVPGSPNEEASTALKSFDEDESKGLIHSSRMDLEKKRRRSETNDHHIEDNPKEGTSAASESHNGRESKDSVDVLPRERKRRKSKNRVKILDPPNPEIVNNSEKMLEPEERDTRLETLEPVIASISDHGDPPEDQKTSKSRKRKSEKPDSSTVTNLEKMLEQEERDTRLETLEPVIASFSDHDDPPDDHKTLKSRKRKSEKPDSSTVQVENAVPNLEKMLESDERDTRLETLEPVIASFSDHNDPPDDRKTLKSRKRKSEKPDSSTLQVENGMLEQEERDTRFETFKPVIASFSDHDDPPDDRKTSKSRKRNSEELDSTEKMLEPEDGDIWDETLEPVNAPQDDHKISKNGKRKSENQAEDAVTNSDQMSGQEEIDAHEETLEPVITSLSDPNAPQDDHKKSKSVKRKSEKQDSSVLDAENAVVASLSDLNAAQDDQKTSKIGKKISEKVDSSSLHAENALISPSNEEPFKSPNLRKRKSSNSKASAASSSHLSFLEHFSKTKNDGEIETKVPEKGDEENLRRSSRRLHNQRSANVAEDSNQTTMIDGDLEKKDHNPKPQKSVSDNSGKIDDSVLDKKRYKVALRKVRKSKSNKSAKKSDQEEMFLNAGDGTFSHFSGSSSGDELETKKKMDYIFPEDDATHTLVIRGPKAQSVASLSTAEASGDELDLSQTSNTSKKRISLSVLLRGSNSYRKAKHGASGSQADDRESQPVDFVPETQPEL